MLISGIKSMKTNLKMDEPEGTPLREHACLVSRRTGKTICVSFSEVSFDKNFNK